jgi:hypothetical protein
MSSLESIAPDNGDDSTEPESITKAKEQANPVVCIPIDENLKKFKMLFDVASEILQISDELQYFYVSEAPASEVKVASWCIANEKNHLGKMIIPIRIGKMSGNVLPIKEEIDLTGVPVKRTHYREFVLEEKTTVKIHKEEHKEEHKDTEPEDDMVK